MKSGRLTPRSIVRRLWAKLDKGMRGAEGSSLDPAAVHDLRVAIRHFNHAVKLFPEVFGNTLSKRVRQRLKKVMTRLGDVRNQDIVPEILRDAKVPPDPQLLREIGRQRRSAERRLARQLKSWRERGVLHSWKDAMEKGGARVLENARLELPAFARELFQAGDYACRHKVPYRMLHKCRLLAKRLRYSLEMFELHHAPQFQQRFKNLKLLQDQLGALNDSVTVIELIPDREPAKRKLRLLRARLEKAFRAFWKRNFDRKTQDWWLRALIPQEGKNGPILTPARRSPAA